MIQFGGGIFGNARIEAVSLARFERGRAAEVVRHGRRKLLTGYLFEADEPRKIVARAEFLLRLQPRLPYSVIGHNCEHIANMCAVGGYTESHQARGFIGVRSLLTGSALLVNERWFRSATARYGLAIAFIAGIGVTATYHRQIKLFWDEIREDRRANERELAEPPRGRLAW